MRYHNFDRIPKFCGVWKKLTPVTQDRWLRTLLHAYVDETTKRGQMRSPVERLTAPKHVGPEMVPGSSALVPVRDYTPFASGIWVFGHLADRLSQGGTAVHLAQPQEVIETLSEWWGRDRADNDIKAHHVTGSFDPRFATELQKRGYPVDAMLLTSLHQTLAQFGARYYPDANLGFVVGCHHDRAHPHFHAVIHPETSSGEVIRFSGLKLGEAGEDKFEYLGSNFNLRARQLFVGLTHSVKPAQDPHPMAAKQWGLLCRHAMLEANPDSVDAPYVAANIFAKAVNAPDYASALVEVADATKRQYLLAQSATADPVHVRKRWGEIRDDWEAKRARVSDAGRKTFAVMAEQRLEPPYHPLCAPHTPPFPPCSLDYIMRAGDASHTHVESIPEAIKARRAASDNVRRRVNAALKGYRAAIEQGRRDRDAVIVQTGFGVAQNEFYGSLNLAAPLDLAELVSAPNSPPVRMLPTLRNTESFAEREMAQITEREAAVHMPADPADTPSILASRHIPRFRELCSPLAELQQAGPTIGP